MTWRRDTPLCIGEPLKQMDAPLRAADSNSVAQPNATDVAIVGAGAIGLSIAWRIARAHGGDLTLTSSGTHGTVFTLTLPVAASMTATG